MNKILLYLSVLLVLFSSTVLFGQTIPVDSLYLGQALPGNVPKIFNLAASAGLRPVERIAITTDGKEIYFTELNTYPPTIARIKYFKYSENIWQGPFAVFEGYAGAKLSANDSIIYMQKEVGGISVAYYSIRNSTGWSVPVRMFNTNKSMHYFQKTNLNNSYCSSILQGTSGSRDLCRIIISNNDTIFQSLGVQINTPDDENDFFVAKDESYLIFSRSSDATAGDMFISYKNALGNWTNPKKIGDPISTPGAIWEYGQFVPDDNKYLFFTRGGSSMSSYYVYWVKIDNIIDSLKHTNFIPYLKNQITNKSVVIRNAFSFVIPDTTFVDDDGNNTLTYSAKMSNGAPLPAWLSFDGVSKKFSGTADSISTISVKVTATDPSNESVSCTFSITVLQPSGTGKSKEQMKKSFYLCQNYPNPFNPSTTIRFSLPQKEFVTLKVHDIMGKEVSVLVNNELDPDEHSVVFNANNLASGMYFYSLRAGDLIENKQMILLK